MQFIKIITSIILALLSGLVLMFAPIFGPKFWFLLENVSSNQEIKNVMNDISGSVPIFILLLAVSLFFVKSRSRPAWLSALVIFPSLAASLFTALGSNVYNISKLSLAINIVASAVAFLAICISRYKDISK